MKSPVFSRYLFALPMVFVFIIAMQSFALAKNNWKIIRTKKVQIIGNTSQKDLLLIHKKINQLENVFSKTFDPKNLYSFVPTNIIVFKNEKSFKKLKPVENGRRKNWVAGFFQPGEDVNYIVLSRQGNQTATARTIFHEYTHSLVNNYFGQQNVPPWINEGLAEYFEHLEVRDDQNYILGLPRFSHGKLLKAFQLKPLDEFFEIDYRSLSKQSKDGIESFYAQSWLLIHYFLNGNDEEKDNLKLFLSSVIKGNSPAAAYKKIFGYDLKDLEKKLKSYVTRENFATKTLILESPGDLKTEIRSQPISEAEAKAFQGDLLYNMHRFDEAEIYLKGVLKLNPNLSLANTSLGLLRMKEGNFEKAKNYLERALKNDSENYLAHYRYAYILSREDSDKTGFIRPFDNKTLEKMRKSLRKAMMLNPNFPESFYLYAFINLVQNSHFDESIEMLEKALAISPDNQWYWMRLSEFYYRKENLPKALEIAKKVLENTRDKKLSDYARRNLKIIRSFQAKLESEEKLETKPKNYLRNSEGLLTEEEQKEIEEGSVVEVLNQMLRRPRKGEERLVGVLAKIDCAKRGIFYSVETEDKLVEFKSNTFENLRFAIFNLPWKGENIGCGSSFPDNLVIVTYHPKNYPDSKIIGEVVGIEFVPDYFKFSESKSDVQKVK